MPLAGTGRTLFFKIGFFFFINIHINVLQVGDFMSYCIYLRKSRADEELERPEGDTLARHRKTLTEYAARQGLNIVKIYEEVVSGDSIVSRPQMQALLSDVEQGKYKGVLVMEVERLARGDTMDQGLVAQTFKYSDTLIITPHKTYNPNNEFDEQFFEFGLFMSRQEYSTIKRRLLRGREASAREGKFVGSIAPYGYERVKIPNDKGYTLKPVPEQAEIVKLIFDLHVNGCKDEFGEVRRLGIQQIARKLNEMGIPSYRHDYWQKESIHDILDNPTYAGYIRWGYRKTSKKMSGGQLIKSRPLPTEKDDYILVKGLHEAIVDPEIYEKAQELAETRPVMPLGYKKEVKNPMAGLIICRKCGRKMTFRRATTPGKPDYLVCHNRACPQVSTPLHLVETALIKSIHNWISDYEYKWKTGNAQDADEKTNALITAKQTQEKELATLNKQLDTTYDLLEQGIYTARQFKERSATLQSRIDEATEKIKSLAEQINKAKNEADVIKVFIPKVKTMLEGYDALTVPQKNILLKEIVEKAIYDKAKSGAFKGVSADDFELELFINLPTKAV